MNTIYVINTKKNHLFMPYVMDKIKIGVEENGMTYVSLILDKNDSYQLQFQKLSNLTQRDVIVTIDFAGFEAETEMGNAYYNILPVRMAHLLIAKDIQYPKSLNRRINFSMFFYTIFPENTFELKKNYPHIENVSYKKELSLFASQQSKKSYGAVLHDIFRDMQIV